jgi:hypothetical protein
MVVVRSDYDKDRILKCDLNLYILIYFNNVSHLMWSQLMLSATYCDHISSLWLLKNNHQDQKIIILDF